MFERGRCVGWCQLRVQQSRPVAEGLCPERIDKLSADPVCQHDTSCRHPGVTGVSIGDSRSSPRNRVAEHARQLESTSGGASSAEPEQVRPELAPGGTDVGGKILDSEGGT